MPGFIGPIEALRRKLRALAAVAGDAGATQHERATAEALKARLLRRLNEAGAPAGDWTDHVFRLGRWAKKMKKTVPPVAPTGDWTETAHQLGKAARRGYKKWLSE
jgi:hypothetical protein